MRRGADEDVSKIGGEIKNMRVYKKTLTIAIIMFCALAVVSVMLNVWNDYEWVSFIINWCVGIACSIFVVIITTYIQFGAENNKLTVELATESMVWLSKFYAMRNLLDKSNNLKELAKSEEWQKVISNYVEGYAEATYKCLALSCEYVSFSKRSTEANKKLNYAFAVVHKLCTSPEYDKKPLELIQKLKFTINIMEILQDLEVLLKPNYLHYVKAKLNELVEKNKTNNKE